MNRIKSLVLLWSVGLYDQHTGQLSIFLFLVADIGVVPSTTHANSNTNVNASEEANFLVKSHGKSIGFIFVTVIK